MTDKKRKERAIKIREVLKRWYAQEGPDKVLDRLKRQRIKITKSRVFSIASELKIAYRDPKEAQLIRKAIKKHYESLGPRGVQEHLRNTHKIEVSLNYIGTLASGLHIKYERGNAQEEPLEGKLRDLIAQGELLKLKDDPIAELHERFRKEAAAVNIAPNFLANRDVFKNKVLEIVWDKETLEALEKVVRRAMSLETFSKYHQHIPQKFVEAKTRDLRGVSSVKVPTPFLRGIGRVTDVSKIDPKNVLRFEATSIDHPYDSGITKSQWTGRVVNGVNLGIKHTPLIEENTGRCVLANASRREEDIVILTNLIDLDLRKAGGAPQVYRSQISGYNTNIDILSPSYQSRARAIASGEEEGLIYENLSEKFLNILSGWKKICIRPDGKPEFSGTVLGILGVKEDEFIKTAAYWELHGMTIKRQKDLDVEISLANHEIKEARKTDASAATIQELIRRRDDLIEERDKTRVSFHRPEDLQNYERRVRTFVVQELEKAIPNLKVIGQGRAYVKIGGEVVLFEIPSHTRVTDELLANFTNHYGPRVLRGEMPKTVVICHPHSLNFRQTRREVDAGGRRGSSRIYVAPIAIDEKFLRAELDQTAKGVHPLEHAIWSGQFQAGALGLHCIDGVVHAEPHTVGEIIKAEVGHGMNAKSRTSPEDNYIWVMVATDQHWGWKWKEFVRDFDNERYLGVCEAAIEMMRRGKLFENRKMPIHMFLSNDDPTQGNHFQIQQMAHQHKMPYADIQVKFGNILKAARRGDEEKRLEIIEDLREWILYQFLVRGEDWTQEQLEQVIQRHLEPNVDFFDALLTRAMNAKLVVRGMSYFNDDDHFPKGTPDNRDIGLVNYGTGNHFKKTVNNELMEGAIYVSVLRLLLRTLPQWNDKAEFLKKVVRAPFYGNMPLGVGVIIAPGGYPWGVEFRNQPPRLSSWGDTLLATVRNDERRANYTRILDRRMTLKTYGDKHFDCAVQTGHTFYHMGAPGTPTETYGENGFPPNNTGVSFVGLPASGPDGGPILVRTIAFDYMRDYFKNPHDIDWAEFLPNPV